jgi:hypothetical protein
MSGELFTEATHSASQELRVLPKGLPGHGLRPSRYRPKGSTLFRGQRGTTPPAKDTNHILRRSKGNCPASHSDRRVYFLSSPPR